MSSEHLDLPLPDHDETGPYALFGTARARPGQADALERRLLALVEPTRREEGALDYHVHRDRADRDLFVFYETWSSIETLKRHLAQPYIKAFLADRMRYLEGDLDIRWLEMRSPFA
jgi:quinol monooxygenase YgiN